MMGALLTILVSSSITKPSARRYKQSNVTLILGPGNQRFLSHLKYISSSPDSESFACKHVGIEKNVLQIARVDRIYLSTFHVTGDQ